MDIFPTVLKDDESSPVAAENEFAALPGEDNPPPKSHRQFTVDFSGETINQLSANFAMQADLTLSGQVERIGSCPVDAAPPKGKV